MATRLGPLLIAFALVLAACGTTAFIPPPAKAGDESFSLRWQHGQAIPDELYQAFLATVVDNFGRARSDVEFAVAQGDLGSTVTAVSIAGVIGPDLLPLMADQAGPGVKLRPMRMAGRDVNVVRALPASTVLLVSSGSTVYVVEAVGMQQAETIVDALP